MMFLRKKKFIRDRAAMMGCFLMFLVIFMSSETVWPVPRPNNSLKTEGSLQFEKGGWIYNSSHYTTVYNTSKTAAQRMTDQLENLRNVFYSAFKQNFDLQMPGQRMKVYLFKTEAEFRQYISRRTSRILNSFSLYDIHTKTLLLLDPQGSPGYQKAVKDLEVLAHRIEETQRRIDFHEQRLTGKVPGSTARGQQWLSDQKRAQHEAQERKLRMALNIKIKALEKLSIATLHEGAHQLRDYSGLWTVSPLWLEEGMAEYFANSEYGRKNSVQTGKKNKHALKEFKDAHSRGDLIPLRSLLAWGVSISINQQLIREDQIPAVYSEFWALFYYLLHGDKGRWRKPFIAYIKDIKENPPSPINDLEHLNRFQNIINADLSAFEQEWIKKVLSWD